MRYFNKYNKGLTLIEILVATIILTITAIAAYATFISASRLAVFSRDELEANMETSAWLELVRTGANAGTGTGANDGTRYQDMAPTATPVDLNAAESILQEDYSSWPLAAKSSVKPNSLTAEYEIDNENLSSDPGGGEFSFRRVTVRVGWDMKE